MEVNAILEIIISLVALFWLLSTACSFVVEALNSLVLNIRAKALERFVCEMVLGSNRVQQLRSFSRFWRRSNLEQTRDPKRPEAGSLADPLGLFSHGLLLALRKPQNAPGGNASPPSYIPATAFAQSLLDRLLSLSWGLLADSRGMLGLLKALPVTPTWRNALDVASRGPAERAPLLFAVVELLRTLHGLSVAQARQQLKALIDELQQDQTDQAVRALPQTPIIPAIPSLDSTPVGMVKLLVDVMTRADEALQALEKGWPWEKQRPIERRISTESLWMLAVRKAGRDILHSPALVQTVRELIDTAPLPVAMREALRPLVAQSNFDADQLRKALEGWFDSVMERATGWFKRYTTLWLGIIGFAAAVFLNVNTVRIAQDLAKDPDLRHAGVAFAEFVIREQGRPELAQQYRFHETATHRGWTEKVAAWTDTNLASCNKVSDCPLMELLEFAREVAPLLLRDGHLQWAIWQLPLESASEHGGRGWTDDVRTRFQTNLCSAMQARKGVAEGHDRVGAKGSASQATLECEWIKTAFPKGQSWEADLEAFWSSSHVVWSHGQDGLGLSLRRLVALANQPGNVTVAQPSAGAARDPAAGSSGKPAEAPVRPLAKALTAFHQAFKNAMTQSAEVHAKARSYLDRIPSLGRDEWPLRWADDKGWAPAWNSLKVLDVTKAWDAIQVSEVAFDRLFPGGVFLDLLGWLITAVMVSFGAAFWFDLLSNLVDRRATGPRPESKG